MKSSLDQYDAFFIRVARVYELKARSTVAKTECKQNISFTARWKTFRNTLLLLNLLRLSLCFRGHAAVLYLRMQVNIYLY